MKRNIIFHPPPWLLVPSFHISGEFPNKIRPFCFLSPLNGLSSGATKNLPSSIGIGTIRLLWFKCSGWGHAILDGEKDRGKVHKPKNLISIANGCFFCGTWIQLRWFGFATEIGTSIFSYSFFVVIREVIRDALLWKLPPAKVGDGEYRMVGFKVFKTGVLNRGVLKLPTHRLL